MPRPTPRSVRGRKRGYHTPQQAPTATTTTSEYYSESDSATPVSHPSYLTSSTRRGGRNNHYNHNRIINQNAPTRLAVASINEYDNQATTISTVPGTTAAGDAVSERNFKVLSRYLPRLTRVLDRVSLATLYCFDGDRGSWDSTDLEGPMFLVSLRRQPIPNRLNKFHMQATTTTTRSRNGPTKRRIRKSTNHASACNNDGDDADDDNDDADEMDEEDEVSDELEDHSHQDDENENETKALVLLPTKKLGLLALNLGHLTAMAFEHDYLMCELGGTNGAKALMGSIDLGSFSSLVGQKQEGQQHGVPPALALYLREMPSDPRAGHVARILDTWERARAYVEEIEGENELKQTEKGGRIDLSDEWEGESKYTGIGEQMRDYYRYEKEEIKDKRLLAPSVMVDGPAVRALGRKLSLSDLFGSRVQTDTEGGGTGS